MSLLKSAISITNSRLCRYDSQAGFVSNFKGTGNVSGWDIFNDIYLYGAWEGVLIGHSKEQSCFISRSTTFDYLSCEFYYKIRIMMKVTQANIHRKKFSAGRIQWLTIQDTIWNSSKQVDFDLIPDDFWHLYEIDLGPSKYWIGDVNNLRIYPFIDGWEGDSFAIENIEIVSSKWKCINGSCSHYPLYNHPCAQSGNGGTCEAGIAREMFNFISGVNDKFIINIDGYGDEVFNLGTYTNYKVYDIAKAVNSVISGLAIGSYTYASVKINEYNNKLIIVSGGTGNESSVSIPDSPAARELGFRDEFGNDVSIYTIGEGSATGFDNKSSRELTGFEINKLISDGDDSYAYIHSPTVYSIEAGRHDYYTTDGSFLASTFSDSVGALFEHDMSNTKKTIIDISHPFTANGKIKYIYIACELPDDGITTESRQNKSYDTSKVFILRPYKNGTLKVVDSVNIFSGSIETSQGSTIVNPKSRTGGQVYSVECDILVHKGDYLGVYNADIYIDKSPRRNRPDATFYHIDGKPSGIFNPGELFMGGSKGFTIYARSDRMQDSVILDFDLGKRYNVDNFIVQGEKTGDFEFNISTFLDSEWKCELYGGTHWHTHCKTGGTPVEHTNMAFGLEALNDGIRASNSSAGDIIISTSDGFLTSGKHSYFYVNGDDEWHDPGNLCGVYDYRLDPVSLYFNFPSNLNCNIHKISIYLKEAGAFEYFELDYYLGNGMENGNATRESGYQVIDKITNVFIDGVSTEDNYRDLSYRSEHLSEYYENPVRFSVDNSFRLIEYEFESINCKGVRLYSHAHRSTKIAEIEVYSKFKLDNALTDVLYFQTSDYGDIWWLSSFESYIDEPTKVYAYISNAPRYLTLELRSLSSFHIKKMDITVGDEVKLVNCSSDLFLTNSRANNLNESTPMILENVYDMKLKLSVDIPRDLVNTNNLLFWNSLESDYALGHSEVGPACTVYKRPGYDIKDYTGFFLRNCPVYAMKNLVDESPAYFTLDGSEEWNYFGTVTSGIPIDFGRPANCAKNHVHITPMTYKYWKLQVYREDIYKDDDDSYMYPPFAHLAEIIRFYFDDGLLENIEEVYIQVSEVSNDVNKYVANYSKSGIIEPVSLVDASFPGKIEDDFRYTEWSSVFDDESFIEFDNSFISFDSLFFPAKNSGVCFYDSKDNPLMSIIITSELASFYTYSGRNEQVDVVDDYVTVRVEDAIITIRSGRKELKYHGDIIDPVINHSATCPSCPGEYRRNSGYKSEKMTGMYWYSQISKMKVLGANMKLSVLPGLSTYEMIVFKFTEPTEVNTIELYTRPLDVCGIAIYVSNTGDNYDCLATSDYISDNLCEIDTNTNNGTTDTTSGKSRISNAVIADSAFTNPGYAFYNDPARAFMPWYLDSYGVKCYSRFWQSGDNLGDIEPYPHWIVYDFGEGQPNNINKVNIVFGQKTREVWWSYYYGLQIVPGGCPNNLIIQASNTYAFEMEDFDGDNFFGLNGEPPNELYWNNSVSTAYLRINDNKLRIIADTLNSNVQVSSTNKWYISGDFDIQIDFAILTPDSGGDIRGPGFRINKYEATNYLFGSVTPSTSKMYFGGDAGVGWSELTNLNYDFTLPGRFRFKRVGDTISCYHSVGVGDWVLDATNNTIIGVHDVEVILFNFTSLEPITIEFDNFKIVGGVVNINPSIWTTLYTTNNITPSTVSWLGAVDTYGNEIPTFNGVENTYTFDNNNYYRYYRFYMTEPKLDSEDWVSIYNIEMMHMLPGPGSRDDLLYIKPCSASSSVEGHRPYLVVDGSGGSSWSSSGNVHQWLEVDAERTAKAHIKKIKIDFGPTDQYQYFIYGVHENMDMRNIYWLDNSISTWNGAIPVSTDGKTIYKSSNTYWTTMGNRSNMGFKVGDCGKWYFEINFTGYLFAGLTTVGVSMAGAINAFKKAWGWDSSSNLIYNWGQSTTYNLGSTGNLGIAVDFESGKLWFRRAGGWFGDPVSGETPAFSNLLEILNADDVLFPFAEIVASYLVSTCKIITTIEEFEYEIPEGYNLGSEAGYVFLTGEPYGIHSNVEFDDLYEMYGKRFRVDVVQSSKSSVDLYNFEAYEYAMWIEEYEYTDYFAVDLGKRYKLGWVYNWGHIEAFDCCYSNGLAGTCCCCSTGYHVYEYPVVTSIDNDNLETSSDNTSDINQVSWNVPIVFSDTFDDGVYLDNWLFSDLKNTIDSSIWEHNKTLDVLSYGTAVSGTLSGPSVTYHVDNKISNFEFTIMFNMTGTGNTSGRYTVELLYQNDVVIKLVYINPPNTDKLGVIRECLYDNDYSHVDGGARKSERFGDNTDDAHKTFLLCNRMHNYYTNVNTIYNDTLAVGIDNYGESRSILKFDLSPIEGVKIVSAKLHLYGLSASGYNSDVSKSILNISIYRVLKRWEYGDISYNYWSNNNFKLWNIAGCSSGSDLGLDDSTLYDRLNTPEDVITVFGESIVDQWHTFDITDLVQKWLNLEIKNYGIFIQASPPLGQNSYSVSFVSSTGDNGFRPYLDIHYYINDTELKYTGEYQAFLTTTNSIKLNRVVSEGTLEYLLNNNERYNSNISLSPVNNIRISYEKYNWDTELFPEKHTTNYFFLNSRTPADNVRWIKIGITQKKVTGTTLIHSNPALFKYNRDVNSYNMRKLFVYSDPSTILAPDGGFNNSWQDLGKEALKLTAGLGGVPANIAFLADVTSNYVLGEYYPSNLTNGDIYNEHSKGWAFNKTDSGEFPYIIIDLKMIMSLNKIYIYNGKRDGDTRYDNYVQSKWIIPFPLIEYSTTASGLDFIAVPRDYSHIYLEDINGGQFNSESNKFEGITLVLSEHIDARRVKITFLNWKSPSSIVFNSSTQMYEVFRGSFIREIEFRYFVETPDPILSEKWPVVAFDLQYKFNIITLLGGWYGYMAYSDSNLYDPQRVSFTPLGYNDTYVSGESSGILMYFNSSYSSTGTSNADDNVITNDNIFTNTEFIFDNGIYFDSGRYSAKYEVYNIENSGEMRLVLDGPNFIDIYTSQSGTLSGTGMWTSISEMVNIVESGYYNVLGIVDTEYSTENMQWGIRYPVISFASESKKKWILTADVTPLYRMSPMTCSSSIHNDIKGFCNESLVITEYAKWWTSVVSILSDDFIITKKGNSSLKISYPESDVLDVVSYDGESLGQDDTWEIKDFFCFWLYISDISALDVDSLNLYIGYGSNYYNWQVNKHIVLKTGWNRIRLKYEDFENVSPKANKYNGKLDRYLDFSSNYGSEFVQMKLFRMVYRGNNKSFFMCVDWFETERNKFDDDVRFGTGICLCAQESCEFYLSNVRLSKGAVEFLIKPYTGMEGTNIFGTSFSRNLIMVNSTSNDVLSIGYSAGKGLQVNVGNLKKGVTVYNVDIDPDEETYVNINEVAHFGLVWDSTGTFMDEYTIKLFINNILVFETKDTWEIKDTKVSAIRLGGAVSDAVYDFGSYGSAIFRNIKFYDYCKTEFDLTNSGDISENIRSYIGSDFIEISKDNIVFYNSDSSELPLVFENVIPGESKVVYIKSNKNENFYKSKGVTAELYVEWEVGV